MAIALDASTPARPAFAFPANNVDVTTSSFTPPADAILVVCASADAAAAITLTCSCSTGITMTSRISAQGGGNHGESTIFTGRVVTSAAMTVSVRRTGNSGSTNGLSFKVYVWTGCDVTTDTAHVGATGSGTSVTNSITPNAYTSTVDNSRGVGCATDWTAAGVPSSTDTEDAFNDASAIDGLSLYKAADTATSGTVVTMNFDGPGTGACDWSWVALELKPAAAAPGGYIPMAHLRHRLAALRV